MASVVPLPGGKGISCPLCLLLMPASALMGLGNSSSGGGTSRPCGTFCTNAILFRLYSWRFCCRSVHQWFPWAFFPGFSLYNEAMVRLFNGTYSLSATMISSTERSITVHANELHIFCPLLLHYSMMIRVVEASCAHMMWTKTSVVGIFLENFSYL